jgi:hypothetical protein
MKYRRLRWIGHLTRMGEERERRIWEDNIKIDPWEVGVMIGD